jgi:hypothetical protein
MPSKLDSDVSVEETFGLDMSEDVAIFARLWFDLLTYERGQKGCRFACREVRMLWSFP